MAKAAKSPADAFRRGTQWLVDASGCNPAALRDEALLRALFDEVLRTVPLRAAAPPLWKAFGGEGGVTGMVLLEESHLTVHTFPEHGYAAVDLYCCAPRDPFDWESVLARTLGATLVRVRAFERSPAPHDLHAPEAPAAQKQPATRGPSPSNDNVSSTSTNSIAGEGTAPSTRDREG